MYYGFSVLDLSCLGLSVVASGNGSLAMFGCCDDNCCPRTEDCAEYTAPSLRLDLDFAVTALRVRYNNFSGGHGIIEHDRANWSQSSGSLVLS